MRGIDELDHYELLEIARTASSAEVDRAYRLAQQTYAEGSLALYSVFERTDVAVIRQRLDEAYRVLADPELRTRYDEELTKERPLPSEQGRAGQEAGGRLDEAAEGAAPGTSTEGLVGFDPAEQLDASGDLVDDYDAALDDGSGEFDGTRLRRSRLFRGYELEDITEVTKVNSAHLRNIESENYGDLPADVYVRGFVTAYARTIGLDPNVVVPSYMARMQESRASSPRGRFLARR